MFTRKKNIVFATGSWPIRPLVCPAISHLDFESVDAGVSHPPAGDCVAIPGINASLWNAKAALGTATFLIDKALARRQD